MQADILYHFKRDRKQRARLFARMALACWLYIAAIFGYDYFASTPLPAGFRLYGTAGFALASAILGYVVWWLRTHPATFEATITRERFRIHYPDVPRWSFDVAIHDIKRFESRNTLSHAGAGIMQHGIVLTNGTFHHISMNYGASLYAMHKAIQVVAPEVPFHKKVNQKVFGALAKDYDD